MEWWVVSLSMIWKVSRCQQYFRIPHSISSNVSAKPWQSIICPDTWQTNEQSWRWFHAKYCSRIRSTHRYHQFKWNDSESHFHNIYIFCIPTIIMKYAVFHPAEYYLLGEIFLFISLPLSMFLFYLITFLL